MGDDHFSVHHANRVYAIGAVVALGSGEDVIGDIVPHHAVGPVLMTGEDRDHVAAFDGVVIDAALGIGPPSGFAAEFVEAVMLDDDHRPAALADVLGKIGFEERQAVARVAGAAGVEVDVDEPDIVPVPGAVQVVGAEIAFEIGLLVSGDDAVDDGVGDFV